MPISSVSRVKTLAIPLSADSGSSMVIVYENVSLSVGSEFKPGYSIVSANCFLKNLKAFSQIQSLDEAPLPDFKVEDSETDKLYKTLDIEWKSARKQLNLYISSNGLELHQIGSTSLLNPYGYPFRIYNLMDLFTDNLALELGENSKISVQFEDVGYGFLADNDRVTIHGSYTEEIFLFSSDIVYIPIGGNGTGTGGNGNTTEDDEMTKWLIKSDQNYTAAAKDKIVIDATGENERSVTVPISPAVGDTIKVTGAGIYYPNTASLNFNGENYQGIPTEIVYLPAPGTIYTIIYFGGNLGWIGDLPVPASA